MNTPTPIKALHVPLTGDARFIEVPPADPEQRQALCQLLDVDWIEPYAVSAEVTILVGLSSRWNQPVNQRAGGAAGVAFGLLSSLHGPVIFIGPENEEESFTALPPEMADLLPRLVRPF